MKRETKWKSISNVEDIRPYIPHKKEKIEVACVRILQYQSILEFSQILQITYKLKGDDSFNFSKYRIKHDFDEDLIKRKFNGIQTYIKYVD